MITRSQKEIEFLLGHPATRLMSEKLILAIEHYIASTDPSRHHKARQELPFMVQFLPMITKYSRHIPLMQAANPGIPHGGLTEYPKSLIYDHIPHDVRINTVDLLSDQMPDIDTVLTAIDTLERPLMLKADRGERGAGIYFLADEDAVRTHRDMMKNGELERYPSSVQEFITSEREYCLQFYHYKDVHQTEQRLFGGLTLRDIPSVVGDGTSRVLDLIHTLDIDTQHQKNIINKLTTTEAEKLDHVPAKGESVTIVRTASLDYGVVYRTIELNEAQQTAIIKLTQHLLSDIDIDLMCVGRFDLKADSLDDLLRGACKVIELNAGGGIPTHVYDEALTIQEKYKLLDEHFSRMLSIARYNIRHGIGSKGTHLDIATISRKSLRKKGISGFDPTSRRIHHIMTYIGKLLHRTRRVRLKKNILGFFH